MPLPKPKNNEKEADFVNRCMGDSNMNEEYPDRDQRFAVCKNLYAERALEKFYNQVEESNE